MRGEFREIKMLKIMIKNGSTYQLKKEVDNEYL